MNRASPDGERLRARAPAKVNLFLEVLGSRPDGYHEIRSVMQAVDLFDELAAWPREDGRIVLECPDPGVPRGEENLVVKAALKLRRRAGCELGAGLRLEKNIPVGGGLGGGSSDAARALLLLRELWGLECGEDELQRVAASVGSDVPFFLRGGTALCEGRGERVMSLPVADGPHYALILPGVQVSTREVYEACEGALTSRPEGVSIKLVREALASGNTERLGANLYNALQTPAFKLYPELSRIAAIAEPVLTGGEASGFSLSGSGSSFFAVFGHADRAKGAARELQRQLSVPVVAARGLG